MTPRLLLVVSFGLATLLSVDAVRAQSAGGRKLALLAGVKSYNHSKLADLKYSERDVSELADLLRIHGGYEVTLLTTERGGADAAAVPTHANMRRAIEATLAGVTKRDIVLIALSGHGIEPEGSQESFFCPMDANPYKPETLLSLTKLVHELDESGVGAKLLLVDACRDDPNAPKGAGKGVDGGRLVALPQGFAALFSCSPGQRSWETEKADGGHGVFFHFVLQGLKGQAVNDRGEVNWSRLVEYVQENVETLTPQWIGDGYAQTPSQRTRLDGRAPVLLAGLKQNSSNLIAQPKTVATPAPIPSQPPLVQTESRTAGTERSDNGLGIELVWCPPGSFTMGSPASEVKRLTNEKQVEVALTRGFWLGKYEVTQSQWEQVMGKRRPWQGEPFVSEGSSFPAAYLSWNDAMEFCRVFTEQEHEADRLGASWHYKLPTEAQWEYACRAGSQTRYSFGHDLSRLADHAWYRQKPWDYDEQHFARQVGLKLPNAWGLYDMHGNVWEWCSDGYRYDLLGGRDPKAGGSEHRLMRGGSWDDEAAKCRSAHRETGSQPYHGSSYGFRLCLCYTE